MQTEATNLGVIEPVLRRILTVNPDRVLDIGAGFGKFGFLMREYLEVCPDRYRKSQWTRRIDAVKVDEQNVMPHHYCIYDNVYVVDLMNGAELRPVLENGYDLVVMCDVLQDVDNWRGLLQSLKMVEEIILTVPHASPDIWNPFRRGFEVCELQTLFHHIEIYDGHIFAWR